MEPSINVNHLPAVNGMYKWKCETCGVEWEEPVDDDYDRTTDGSNWPVFCEKCENDFTSRIKAVK